MKKFIKIAFVSLLVLGSNIKANIEAKNTQQDMPKKTQKKQLNRFERAFLKAAEKTGAITIASVYRELATADEIPVRLLTQPAIAIPAMIISVLVS